MRSKIYLAFILVMCGLGLSAQCPWNFTVTTQFGGFSITCISSSVNLGAVNDNTNSVSYNWSGPAFSATSTNVSLTQSGNYTLQLTDVTTSCAVTQTFDVVTNTTSPHVSVSLYSQTLTCYNPTLLATGTSTTPNAIVGWLAPPPLQLNYPPTIIIGPPTGPSTSSILLTYANYTVTVTNTLNGCSTNSVVVISQNFKPPVTNPVISIGTPTAICNSNNPVILTTGSTITTGWPPFQFLLVDLWAGPPPQQTVTGAPIYSCYVPGVYTLTLRDNYNGCKNTGTVNVTSNQPLFNLHGTAPSSSVSCNGSVYIDPLATTNYSISVNTGSLTGNVISDLCYGKLVVCLTNTNTNCKKCDSLEINAATAIKELNFENEFTLYPNPTNSTLYIKNIQQNPGTIKTFNVEGKEIENLILESLNTMEINNLNSGIYFVEIRIENSVVRKKVVVIK